MTFLFSFLIIIQISNSVEEIKERYISSENEAWDEAQPLDQLLHFLTSYTHTHTLEKIIIIEVLNIFGEVKIVPHQWRWMVLDGNI